MPTDRMRYQPLALALGLALTTLVPYLLAIVLTPEGWHFPGVLLNPYDGFSYLAKMRQGFQGEWLFTLPYAAEPGQGVLIFTFYLFLGHISRLIAADLPLVFHGIRLLSVLLMAYFLYHAFHLILEGEKEAALALAISLFGAGVGWITGPMGLESTDLFIPESIPFQSSLINPHFPLATGLIAASIALTLRGGRWPALLPGMILGGALAVVLPFSLFPLLGGLLAWLTLERLLNRASVGNDTLASNLFPVAGIVIGAAPLIAYDVWISFAHPVLKVWNQQNQTPSPHPLGYLSGYGLILVAGLLGIWLAKPHVHRKGRLLLIWLVVNGAMLYAPFNLQRRLSLGLMIPLAALAVMGLKRLGKSARWITPALVILSLPSNLLVIAAGLSQVSKADPQLLLTSSERAGYEWIAEHVEENSLVLAAPLSGNRLPAYAPVRVVYGHPFETPRADERREQVLNLLTHTDSETWISDLRRLGVTYVLIGPHELRIGADPAQLELVPVLVLPGFELVSASER